MEHDSHLTEKKSSFAPLKPLISIGQLSCVDLRVGTILEAQAVPKSKKLLQLKVDLGFETRTILSGISLFFSPEQLIGKEVVVVANLQSAKLMGIESQGMLLAGSNGDNLELLELKTLTSGSEIS